MARTDRLRNLTRRQRVALSLGFLAASWLVTFWAWVVAPPAADPDGYVEASDAVVMFVGRRGERLEAALELMADGVGTALVIPNGLATEWPAGNEVCQATNLDFEVFCPEPDPDNTRGEARLIAALAEAEGWRSLVFVTSDYHVTRAGRLLESCFDGRVQAVAADSDLGATTWLRRAVREWFGNVAVRTVDRGC